MDTPREPYSYGEYKILMAHAKKTEKKTEEVTFHWNCSWRGCKMPMIFIPAKLTPPGSENPTCPLCQHKMVSHG